MSDKVKYKDYKTGKEYDKIPENYTIPLIVKDQPITEEAYDKYYENNPINLEDIEIYPDPEFIPNDTEQNLKIRDNIKREDDRIAEATAFHKPLNFLSPSQWFGAYINYLQGESPFWKGIYDGNSGYIPDKFANEYPRATVLLNMLGDTAFGKVVSKTPSGYRYLTEPIEYGGAESKVVTSRISPFVTKYSSISPTDAHSLNQIENFLKLNYKGTQNGQAVYTQPKAIIFKNSKLLYKQAIKDFMNKGLKRIQEFPGYDSFEYPSRNYVVTDLGEYGSGQLGWSPFRPFKPSWVDLGILSKPDYLSIMKNGGNIRKFKNPSGSITKEQIALKRSRQKQIPNSNFSNSWDLDWLGKLKGLLGRGATCTNTATSFYYPDRPTAGSNNLLNNPSEAGFQIINQKDAVPGSIIVISNPDGTGRHTAIFDSVYKGEPYWYYDSNDKNQYYVQEGDTLVNYSNGKHGFGNYRKGIPLNKAFVNRTKHIYLKSK